MSFSGKKEEEMCKRLGKNIVVNKDLPWEKVERTRNLI